MAGPESFARAVFTGAGIALGVMMLLHGTGALAQSAGGYTQTSASSGVSPVLASESAADSMFDTPTLTAFVAAAQQVGALRDKYMPRVTAANIAERAERAEALFDEMRARMHDAIDQAGISMETYEAISKRSAEDARLRARIEGILSGAGDDPVSSQGARVNRAATPMAKAQRAMDGAAAQREIAALQRRLADMQARLTDTQRRAGAEVSALRASHRETVSKLKTQLAARPSADVALSARQAVSDARMMQFRVETRIAAERDVLRREITHLTRALGKAVASLETLGHDLAAEGPTGSGQPFSRLDPEPVLFAGSASGLTRGLATMQPNTVMQARLDASQTRNLALRNAYASRRAILGREITRIADDLAAARESLAALDASLAPVESFTPTEAVLQATPEPVMPEQAVAEPDAPGADALGADALGAGARAYDAQDYARAYELWQPLAEAGTPMAQFHLGALYFEGRGVPRDLTMARSWLSRALDQGVERARFLLGRVEKGLAQAG